MVVVAASLLSADFLQLSSELDRLQKASVDWLHFDVMDGHFVPNITMGPGILAQVRAQTDLPLDVHLMIESPELYIQAFADVGADYITVHVEACTHLHRVIEQIKTAGCKAGVAINPGTSIETVEAILPFVDLVLIMSVNPGFGGQKFIPQVLEKVAWLEQQTGDFLVSIDGGITSQTASFAKEAGVDVLVSGSYLFGAGNLSQAVDSLK